MEKQYLSYNTNKDLCVSKCPNMIGNRAHQTLGDSSTELNYSGDKRTMTFCWLVLASFGFYCSTKKTFVVKWIPTVEMHQTVGLIDVSNLNWNTYKQARKCSPYCTYHASWASPLSTELIFSALYTHTCKKLAMASLLQPNTNHYGQNQNPKTPRSASLELETIDFDPVPAGDGGVRAVRSTMPGEAG